MKDSFYHGIRDGLLNKTKNDDLKSSLGKSAISS